MRYMCLHVATSYIRYIPNSVVDYFARDKPVRHRRELCKSIAKFDV